LQRGLVGCGNAARYALFTIKIASAVVVHFPMLLPRRAGERPTVLTRPDDRYGWSLVASSTIYHGYGSRVVGYAVDAGGHRSMSQDDAPDLAQPTILVALLFRTIDAVRIFDLPRVLTNGGPGQSTETLVLYAYNTLFTNLNFGYGSALSFSTFLIVVLVIFPYIKILGAPAQGGRS